MADSVKLGDRYEVLLTTPLPGLNSVGGTAQTARSLRDKRGTPFAIVCDAGILPRTDIVNTVASVENATLMRLLDHGVVDWPPDKARHFTFIFEKPPGRRLMETVNDTVDPMPEDALTRHIIQPIVGVLKELSGRGVVHGAIRPSNLFLRDLASGGLVVGECLSTPTGFGQPVLLETVERGMAHPAGRGTGTTADDLYSFGVTLLLLLLGRNPVAGLDDDTIQQAKIERGTYPALVGTMRLPMAVAEPLRGLMVDDPKQRWTLNDLDLWLSGRRLSPKQPQIPRRAARPLEFQGADYWYYRTLARAMSRNPAAATPVIENGELDKWLRRSMSDEARGEIVNQAVQSASSTGKAGSVTDRLLARVCLALDPTAPIRYRNKAIMPSGIGPALAHAFMRDESPQAIGEIVGNQLPMFWVSVQPEFRPEFVPLAQSFDHLRSNLERSGYGLGIERVLYELNPTAPCLSPLVASQYPLTPADLLRALDVHAASSSRAKEPMDRHIAAFLAVHQKRSEEMFFGQLAPTIDPQRRFIAMLTILSEVQARSGADHLPHLCAWLVSLLDPAFKRFYSRPRQAEVRRQAQAAAEDGRLPVLLKVVDDPEAIRQDRSAFEAAQLSYREVDGEIERLKRMLGDRDGIIATSGRQVAAIISSMVSTVLLAGLIFIFAL
jgi:hypothetical protein